MAKSWRDSGGRDVEIGKTTTGEGSTTEPATHISGTKARVSSAAEVVGRTAGDVRDTASQGIGNAADVASRQLNAAGDVMRDVLQNVELEELTIRGKVSGHGFQVNIEDDQDGKRFLALRLDLRTDEGDELRIVGRKVLPPIEGGATSGTTGSSTGSSSFERGGRGIGGEEGVVEGRTSPTGRGGY
jgi:hypothetical protein